MWLVNSEVRTRCSGTFINSCAELTGLGGKGIEGGRFRGDGPNFWIRGLACLLAGQGSQQGGVSVEGAVCEGEEGMNPVSYLNGEEGGSAWCSHRCFVS